MTTDTTTTNVTPLVKPEQMIEVSALAERANAAHDRVTTCGASFLSHAIEAGIALLEAQKVVGYGAWLQWLGDNCSFSDRTARGYIKIAKGRDKISNGAANLSLREAFKLLGGPKKRAKQPSSTTTKAKPPKVIAPPIAPVSATATDDLEIPPAFIRSAQPLKDAFNRLSPSEQGAFVEWLATVHAPATDDKDSFIHAAKRAADAATYDGKIDGDVVSAANAVVSAWSALADDLHREHTAASSEAAA